MSKSFYITTTLPYVNAPLHIGHALEFIRSDSLARIKILQGNDVFFNTGTDEHGVKIFNNANNIGLSPQEYVDNGFKVFKDQVSQFGILEDINFIRTTDDNHIKAAQEFWKRVNDNGYIYKKNYKAKYCIGCEEIKTDSELVGGECPIHPGSKIELIDEENYFFKLSILQDSLTSFYSSHSDFVIPEFRFNEIKSFVSRGLDDFSISRLKDNMPWGIPVPGDDKHVMYVWFDALVNYISTLGWPNKDENFNKYWIDGTPTQYCGKDNTRFQALIWQAMLIAAGISNSHQIVVNGFITADKGVRMSKSLGNGIDPSDIISQYGTDALRMFLLKEISSFEDSPFTLERFRDSYNANLANGLGNLTSRIMTLSEKYCDAWIGLPDPKLFNKVCEVVEKFDLQKAITIIWEEIGLLDSEIQISQPFKVVKEDLDAGRDMISGHVGKLYTIAEALSPFMPETSKIIIDLIRDNKKPENPLFVRL